MEGYKDADEVWGEGPGLKRRNGEGGEESRESVNYKRRNRERRESQ
jgi:hypothetical protein